MSTLSTQTPGNTSPLSGGVMAVTIGSNIASLRAQRQLGNATDALSQVFERLSSGARINRASDDAAGLAISDSLRADTRVFSQGVRNLNDGISFLSIADGAISELSSIVTRIRELAEQSANGVLAKGQRKALDAEAQALDDEYTRIINSTKFNGTSPFDGSFQQLRLQSGYGAEGGIASNLGGARGTGAVAKAGTFVTESFSSTGVALGDVNGDGMLDMVTSGYGGNGEVTVRLATGAGVFGAATLIGQGGTKTNAVKLGDVNGDGILDVVTAGTAGSFPTDGYMNVQIGKGNGTFQSIVSYAATSGMTEKVSLADLNGDGRLDVVTSGTTDAFGVEVVVRLGTGNGLFGAASTYASTSGGFGRSLALGDMNNDGTTDLLLGTFDGVEVRLGNSNGTFGAAISYSMASVNSREITVGDFNGDGMLDMVSAGYVGADGYAAVRLGVGNGTFKAAVSYAAETNKTNSVTVGDLNGDSILDLVTAGYSDANVGFTTVRIGVGNGTFGAAASFASETARSTAVALGDLNEDSVLDIVTAGRSAAGSANIHLSSTIFGTSPLLPFSLLTQSDALQAMGPLDKKLAQLASQRGTIGAFQSRVESAISVSSASITNFAAAESRIRDADIAGESSELTRLSILQQASSAVLAQANQQPRLAISLLR